jgi:hypothetical protein
MKRTPLAFFVAFAMIVLSGCSHSTYYSSKPLPPGQAKKITGSKSAKAYAPGQQKKKHQ